MPNTSAQEFIRQHNSLHRALQAGLTVLDVVILDEFTYDVVAQLPKDAGAALVVVDCT